MGLFDSIKDHFNNAEFSIAPNKKLKTISKDFKSSFNLSFFDSNLLSKIRMVDNSCFLFIV